jgi:hypothetical protein
MGTSQSPPRQQGFFSMPRQPKPAAPARVLFNAAPAKARRASKGSFQHATFQQEATLAGAAGFG